ncbi:hypothetical protein LXD80_13680 [Enterobacter sp. ASE]|uniref:hypothetical protein n=1 Tax=Enterobacter sp. ASE TaxID=2905968 RepID=UPI001E521C7C|nr:hypothetical protein [Enterobacter sp. ASE]MCE3116844.1 hypothetical protein [Enterobacter sp. ASE]
MALTDDELIAISALPKGTNDNATLQPDLIAPYEVRDSTDSVFALPYQNTNIDVFGGGAAGSWSLNFQNPLQRVVLDLEVFFGDRSAESAPPNLSALTMTLTGFSSGVIFAPATTYDAAAPANYFGLTVSGLTPVIKLGGKRRRLEQSGQVIIPLVAVLLSENPLTTQETYRTLSVTLKRTDETQTSVVPIVGGMVYSNPLPSARDRLVTTK